MVILNLGGTSSWFSMVAMLTSTSVAIYIQHLEKEMATHSSILAWRIPWMEEPGGLQSMGSLGHDFLSFFLSFFLSLFSVSSPAHVIFRCLDGGHVVLTYISMMVGGVEHLFIYLLTFWISSLEKGCFFSSAHF